MTTRIISDEDLIVATALVSESMLRALPEPEECTGHFSAQFEERIEKLKKSAERKANWRKVGRSAVAAVLVVLIGFSMLFAFNIEVRAAVLNWFKETFESYTTYWFTSNVSGELPQYELTWLPVGCELISEDLYEDLYSAVYLCEDNVEEGFTFAYSFSNVDTQLTIQSHYGESNATSASVNGHVGELYKSENTDDASVLVWFDEENDVVFTITSLMDPEIMVRVASNVKIK